MRLSSVPATQPQNVLGSSRDVTQGAAFGLGCIAEMECSLDPRVEMVFVLLLQVLPHLLIGVPVQAGDEILMMWFAGYPMNALLLCFSS